MLAKSLTLVEVERERLRRTRKGGMFWRRSGKVHVANLKLQVPNVAGATSLARLACKSRDNFDLPNFLERTCYHSQKGDWPTNDVQRYLFTSMLRNAHYRRPSTCRRRISHCMESNVVCTTGPIHVPHHSSSVSNRQWQTSRAR